MLHEQNLLLCFNSLTQRSRPTDILGRFMIKGCTCSGEERQKMANQRVEIFDSLLVFQLYNLIMLFFDFRRPLISTNRIFGNVTRKFIWGTYIWTFSKIPREELETLVYFVSCSLKKTLYLLLVLL